MEQRTKNLLMNRFCTEPYGYCALRFMLKELISNANPFGIGVKSYRLYNYNGHDVCFADASLKEAGSCDLREIVAPLGTPATLYIDKLQELYEDGNYLVDENGLLAVVRVRGSVREELSPEEVEEEAERAVLVFNRYVIERGLSLSEDIYDAITKRIKEEVAKAARHENEWCEKLRAYTEEFVENEYKGMSHEEVAQALKELPSPEEGRAKSKAFAEEYRRGQEENVRHIRKIGSSFEEKALSSFKEGKADKEKINRLTERIRNGERPPFSEIFDAFGFSAEEFGELKEAVGGELFDMQRASSSNPDYFSETERREGE